MPLQSSRRNTPVEQNPKNAKHTADYFAQEHSSARENVTIGVFRRLLMEQLGILESTLLKQLSTDSVDYGKQRDELLSRIRGYKQKVLQCCTSAQQGETSRAENPLFFRLRKAFLRGDTTILNAELKNAYVQYTSGVDFTILEGGGQEKLTNMRNPLDWYPATRAVQREIHLHVGPTNSGKTYHALKRLEEAKTGVYAGPLRLLAHEVYSRFTAKGKQCALITGEEQRIPSNMTRYMSSCTVEMVPLNTPLEVAVIDEIQMLSDHDRGWAWTQALLGVKAKEVHLCGEVRATELIQKLCKLMGDKLIIHNYERLTPLKSMNESLKGDLNSLQKGDAIILFSRVAIHAMKTNIEKATGRRCAVVYGSLPPETRAQQAALFNDPDNDYDFLVASDAVGMGLNLSIKRVVFEATSKYDGRANRLMPASHIKQIAGRAGRYAAATDANQKTSILSSDPDDRYSSRPPPSKNVGYVTTLEDFDLPIVRAALRTDVEPLKMAGLHPPGHIVERFASYFPRDTPFSYILLRLHELASVNPEFFLCTLGDQIDVANCIQEFELSVKERLTFIAAPVSLRDPGFVRITKELAACVSSKDTNGHILDLKSFNLELLEQDMHDYPNGAKGYLKAAETLHKALTLYMWLGYRFAGLFTSHKLALHLKEMTETKIEECLSVFEYDDKLVKARAWTRRKQLTQELEAMSRRKEWTNAASSPKLDDGAGMPPDWSETLETGSFTEGEDDVQEMADLETVVENSNEPHVVSQQP